MLIGLTSWLSRLIPKYMRGATDVDRVPISGNFAGDDRSDDGALICEQMRVQTGAHRGAFERSQHY